MFRDIYQPSYQSIASSWLSKKWTGKWIGCLRRWTGLGQAYVSSVLGIHMSYLQQPSSIVVEQSKTFEAIWIVPVLAIPELRFDMGYTSNN